MKMVADVSDPLTKGLASAYDRYWSARSAEDQRAAYFEILLCGGADGYPCVGVVRQRIARILRQIAARIDGFGA